LDQGGQIQAGLCGSYRVAQGIGRSDALFDPTHNRCQRVGPGLVFPGTCALGMHCGNVQDKACGQ